MNWEPVILKKIGWVKAINRNVYEKTKYAEQVQTRVRWEGCIAAEGCAVPTTTCTQLNVHSVRPWYLEFSVFFPCGQKIIEVDAPKGETQKVKRTDVYGRGRLLSWCRGSSASAEQRWHSKTLNTAWIILHHWNVKIMQRCYPQLISSIAESFHSNTKPLICWISFLTTLSTATPALLLFYWTPLFDQWSSSNQRQASRNRTSYTAPRRKQVHIVTPLHVH